MCIRDRGYGILNFGNALNSYLKTSENILKNTIKIYPIPAKNEINISSSEKIENISIYNSFCLLYTSRCV